jgi:hypothetical protein
MQDANPTTKEEGQLEFADLISQIGALTRALLEEGAEPSQLAFALTTVAADMGLELTRDPLAVLPVLLHAIALEASRRGENGTNRCWQEHLSGTVH